MTKKQRGDTFAMLGPMAGKRLAPIARGRLTVRPPRR
jgi:hypothetical protein